MAGSKSPTLSYNSQHHFVRLELTRSMTLESLKPPADLVKRVEAKLNKVKDEGKIEFFDIYTERLDAVWAALRSSSDENNDDLMSFILAAGSPLIEGISITTSLSDTPGIVISMSGPIDAEKTSVEWVRARILKVARDNGLYANLFQPHVVSALARITAGDTLSNFLIESRQDGPKFSSPEKPFAVFANRSREEVVAFINDLKVMHSQPSIDRLCDLVQKATEKLHASGLSELVVMRTEITSQIKAAISGPERLGIGMPMAILVAMPDLEKRLGKKFLNFAVSEDKMEASVCDFDLSVYNDPAFKLSKDFLVNQLKKSDLRGEINDADVSVLVDLVGKRESLNGKIVARGRPAVSGSEPYVHLVFKDAPKLKNENDIINMRETQQRAIVQAGQLVAEIRYLKPEIVGMNVLGKAILPEPGPSLEVTLGEGVQQREVGKFYAEYGGVPVCEDGNKITLTKSHVHEGDVNLKSGNIYFDGPVEIKGSVDSGALVRVKGPVKIHGSITGGTVISRDPIEVVESIVTGSQGKVICSTHIKADFIENSTIECDGSVVVAKSLVSSDVVAGDYIQALAPDGIIGGGTILCRNLVAAANIGFAKGARTKFIVGVDHRIIRRTKIREKRLQNLLAAQERYKLEFRELAQKKESQLTPKHKQQKETLKQKMSDVRPIIETVTSQLEVMKSSMAYNQDALIAATNVFAANCQVEVGGQGVVLEADTMAVGISARKRRDSHLCTFDEIKSEIERKLTGSSAPVVAPAIQSQAAESPEAAATVTTSEAVAPASKPDATPESPNASEASAVASESQGDAAPQTSAEPDAKEELAAAPPVEQPKAS